ncbi:MAG: flagellar hook-associated protein FlgL [Dechloromonas sp.]|uniref:flagellar hook-associated protein FlgL n=1 Tax=Azonexaceae TaxID=2008795 RepID=UPI001CF90AAE|nr:MULTISPECIES: flagellar hook-associated protein FlgL [Azonexaceae]MBT9520821.1 flagellar hook-associated protein FlgL [Dechloromonas sp.]UCV23767.1 flagellar hook-associated protein FlgL [Ferribacterium limneticum]
MRISTSMMFDTGTQNMLQLQTNLYKLQNQMSTGRRILTPSDDPVAAAQALEVSQRQSINSQFMDNQGNAASQLTNLESTLRSASDLISNVMSKAAEADNPNINDTSRQAIAFDINENFGQLLGLANSMDGLGQHLFSGFRGDTEPFGVSGSPGSRITTYHGDDGNRQLQVETGRLMDVSESGSDMFMRIPQGNGQFMASAGAANTGTGVLGASSTVSGYDGSTYQLTFTAPGVYDVYVNGAATPTLTGQVYTAGSDISLGPAAQQIKINISGTPAAGDTFTAQPASNQDIFTTLDSMIKALNANVGSTPATKAAFKNQMTQIRQNLDQAFGHLLTAQTSVGARRLELENLSNAGADRDLQYQTDLKNLQELDYTKAISDMANQKMVLEAAQLSFKQVSQMSLFNYL